MKKIITTCLILLSMTAIAQNAKNNVTIYQDGKEFEVKGDTIPIELKNKKFSVRFNVEKDNPTALLAFIADREGFLYVGNRGENEVFHCFSPGTHKAAVRGEKPKTFQLNNPESGSIGNYYLYDFYLKDLPSDDKNLLRKELVITSVEGVTMKDFFLENLYLILYPKPEIAAIDKELMTKISLHFPDFKQQNITTLNSAEHLAKGKALFSSKSCTACHLEDGGGLIGPNLTDNKWILGGGAKNIYNVIAKGGRPGKGMITWGESALTDQEIKLLTNYIISIQGTRPKNPKEAEGDIVWSKK